MTNFTSLEVIEWNAKYRPTATYDLSSSSASNISIADLFDISENRARSEECISLNKIKLEENDSGSGSAELRQNLAALYSARSTGVTPDDILITNGGSAASYAALSALLKAGDHIICQSPVEELLYKIPASMGVEVTKWHANPTKRWQLDTEELKPLIKENTKLIVIQNPCDPTGAVIPKPLLESLIEIAEERGILVLADETYRPLFHSILPSNEDFPPSTINLGYRKVIVTGTVGKVYSLAGIQAGWIASKDPEIMAACRKSRSIASLRGSTFDETVAAEALSDRCIHALLAKNIRLLQTNLELLEGFIEEHSWACSWVKPLAGTTAMIKFHKMGKPVDSERFCLQLLEQAGLHVCPASKCFGNNRDFRGYVRVALGRSTQEVKAAIEAWNAFMEESFDSVATASSK